MSVRQRIERQERAALEFKMHGDEKDFVAPVNRTVREQTVSVSSVRQRLDNAASDAAGDEVIRPAARPTELTQAATYNTSVRDRLNKERDAAQPPELDLRTGTPRELSLAEQSRQEDARLAQASRDNARKVAEGQERARQRGIDEAQQRENLRAEAQRKRDERVRQENEQRENRAKMIAVDLMIADASPKEAQQVKNIVARNFPADKFDPERHWRVLAELRAAVGIQ